MTKVIGGAQSDEPGWAPAVKGILYGFIPAWGIKHAQKRSNGDGLLMTRTLFLSFTTAVAVINVVVALLATGKQPADPLQPWIGAAVVVGVAIGNQAILRFIERPLDATSTSSLAAAYKTRFFLRIAFAESTALIGFVMFFLTGKAWLYPLAAALSIYGFWRAAPTAANLQRDQERIGPVPSLVRTLRGMVPPL